MRAGKTTSGIDGRLGLGGTISGRVTGTAANPLRNICVIAAGQSGGADRRERDRQGWHLRHRGPGLRPVYGRVLALRQPEPCHGHRARPGDRAARDDRRQCHACTPGGSIAGVVTAGSASGPPVSDGCVEVYSHNSAEPVGFGYTGPDGSYLATGLAAGNYQVYFGDPLCILSTPGLAPQWYNGASTQAKATPVPVTVSATTSSINAALQPDGEITGTVSSSSAPSVSGVCVTAVPLPAAGSLRIVAVSRPGGYALADLLPGRYKVEFSSGCGATGYASQWWKDASSQAAAKVITVVAGQDVSGISAKLSR